MKTKGRKMKSHTFKAKGGSHQYLEESTLNGLLNKNIGDDYLKKEIQIFINGAQQAIAEYDNEEKKKEKKKRSLYDRFQSRLGIYPTSPTSPTITDNQIVALNQLKKKAFMVNILLYFMDNPDQLDFIKDKLNNFPYSEKNFPYNDKTEVFKILTCFSGFCRETIGISFKDDRDFVTDDSFIKLFEYSHRLKNKIYSSPYETVKDDFNSVETQINLKKSANPLQDNAGTVSANAGRANANAGGYRRTKRRRRRHRTQK